MDENEQLQAKLDTLTSHMRAALTADYGYHTDHLNGMLTGYRKLLELIEEEK